MLLFFIYFFIFIFFYSLQLMRRKKLLTKKKKKLLGGAESPTSKVKNPTNLLPPPPPFAGKVSTSERRPTAKIDLSLSEKIKKIQESMAKIMPKEDTLVDKLEEFLTSKEAVIKKYSKRTLDDDYSSFFSNPEVIRKTSRIKFPGDILLRNQIRQRKMELSMVVIELEKEDLHFDTRGINLDLVERLEISALDIDTENLLEKYANELIKNICIMQNINELTKITKFLEADGQDGNLELDHSFYTGKTTTGIEYIGSGYEESTYFDTEFGSNTTMIVTENRRDFFMIDFDYTSLNGVPKKKLPFYKSTGTNFSAIQRGYLAPFNGSSLYMIPYSKQLGFSENSKYYKVMLDFANFLFPDLFEDKSGILVSGEIGNCLLYHSREWEHLFRAKKIYMNWIIKFASFFNFIDGVSEKMKAYEGWSHTDEIRNLLGNKYFQKQLLKGNIIQTGSLFTLLDLREPMKIIENKGITLSERDVLEQKNLFHKRYFGSEELFSFRNMAFDIPVENKKRSYEINEKIGKNNIFDKDLVEVGKMIDTGKLEIKIMAYIYDILYYCTTDDYRHCVADINDVLRLLGKDITLEVFQDSLGFYNCPDKHMIKDIVDILKEEGKNILESGSTTCKKTIFYNFIKLPLYEDINSPP
jgi:hypothetical protein